MTPLSVIIADDDQLMLDYLKTLLDWDALGFVLTATAANGTQALKLVRRHRPAILITDIIMPGIDGLALIEQLKEIQPDLQILIITSHDEFDYARRAISLNVSDYILKNEISAASLTAKLTSLAFSIAHSNQISGSFLSQELAAYFANGSSTVKLSMLPASLTSLSKERYYFFILSQIMPYTRTVAQAAEARRTSIRYLTSILTQMEAPAASFYFPCDDFLLFAIRLESPKRERAFFLHSLTKKIWQRTRSNANQPCALFFYPHRLGIGSFREIFFSARPLLAFYSMFCPNGPADLKQLLACERFEPRVRPFPFQRLDGVEEHAQEHILLIRDYVMRCYENRNLSAILEFYQNFCAHMEILSNGRLTVPETRVFYSHESLLKWMFNTYTDCIHMHRSENVSPYSPAIRAAIAFIEQNYSSDALNTEVIARHASLSVSRLNVLFKQETNRTVNEYVTELRMEHAVWFLQNTTMKIYEIAEKCGYRSSQYFSTVFCSHTGKRPIDYRKN